MRPNVLVVFRHKLTNDDKVAYTLRTVFVQVLANFRVDVCEITFGRMNYSFARLPDSRLEEAFEILQLVSNWLAKQKIRQRIAKLRIETYRQWQSESTNWIVTDNDQIRGVVTLRKEPLCEWPEFENLGSVWMLRALATHPDHFGKGIGGFTVSEAIGQCSGDPSFLDCVSESLPSFYNRQGFEAIGKQIRSYPDEVQPYNITLMRHSPICDVL